ncbi:hypothetical protein PAP_06170 [Palaeococcus pacificus DY20341]|uniref:Uncharacterized protein n=1 Tax=Palaeococcus pacificus DY20341 TaxID=1343739 RepID=A0A075LTI3_9EURY|nr:hypothetical protein [Palaeococcus pacificus]AIF69634.1 hypothetical protein PAP_06170 [Palaeococcus pacificus DY20341]
MWLICGNNCGKYDYTDCKSRRSKTLLKQLQEYFGDDYLCKEFKSMVYTKGIIKGLCLRDLKTVIAESVKELSELYGLNNKQLGVKIEKKDDRTVKRLLEDLELLEAWEYYRLNNPNELSATEKGEIAERLVYFGTLYTLEPSIERGRAIVIPLFKLRRRKDRRHYVDLIVILKDFGTVFLIEIKHRIVHTILDEKNLISNSKKEDNVIKKFKNTERGLLKLLRYYIAAYKPGEIKSALITKGELDAKQLEEDQIRYLKEQGINSFDLRNFTFVKALLIIGNGLLENSTQEKLEESDVRVYWYQHPLEYTIEGFYSATLIMLELFVKGLYDEEDKYYAIIPEPAKTTP